MSIDDRQDGNPGPGEWHPGRPEGYTTDGVLSLEEPAAGVDLGTVHEPARDTVVYAETDVLVVGGGPAGCAAAIAARRAGARVTLVERYNHLGGLSTGGLVIWIDRMTDWSGFPVISGFAGEILDRLPADAVAGAPRDLWGSTDPAHVAYWRERLGAARETVTWSPMIDPEWLKTVSAELVHQEGVTLLLHSWVVGAIREDRTVRGVLFESKEGRRAIMAKVVIDTTGVPDVDVSVANHLVQTVDASRLMGASVIITGLSSKIAQTLVTIGVDLGKMNTIGDLQGGIEEAERLLGFKVIRVDDEGA